MRFGRRRDSALTGLISDLNPGGMAMLSRLVCFDGLGEYGAPASARQLLARQQNMSCVKILSPVQTLETIARVFSR